MQKKYVNRTENVFQNNYFTTSLLVHNFLTVIAYKRYSGLTQ